MTDQTCERRDVCDWCAEPISDKALRCPHCRTWRRDIEENRLRCWFWSMMSIPIGLLMGAGCLWIGIAVGLKASWTLPLTLTLLFAFIGGGAFVLSLVYWRKVSKRIGTAWWV